MNPTTDILSRTVSMILAGGRGERLFPLTQRKPKPLVTYGGIYRLIDFTLSNCLNSHLQQIYMLSQHMFGISDRRHERVRTNFRARRPLLRNLLPAPGRRYQGTADALFQNIHFLERGNVEFVLVLAGDHIYKMDYGKLLRFHVDSGAEVTISAIEYPRARSRQFGILEVDSRRRIVGFEEKPENPKPIPTDPTRVLANMGVYVFNTSTLIAALSADSRRETSRDVGKDLLPDLVRSHRSYAYNFWDEGNKRPSYWRDLGTLDAYYEASMDLLEIGSTMSSFDDKWPIRAWSPQFPHRTSVVSEAFDGSLCASISNSLVFPGSFVNRGRVFHSVLSPGVQVSSDAEVGDSVLLPGVRIGDGARVRHAIVDENVRIPAGARIGYDLEEDRHRFVVSDNGIVVISDNVQMDSLDARRIEHDCKYPSQKALIYA